MGSAKFFSSKYSSLAEKISKYISNQCHPLCREGLEFLLDYNEYRSSNEKENIHAVIHVEALGMPIVKLN